jgi:hypothetical protein
MTFNCFWNCITSVGPLGTNFLPPRGARIHYKIANDALEILPEGKRDGTPYRIKKTTAEEYFKVLEFGPLPANFIRDHGWFRSVHVDVKSWCKCDSDDRPI